MEFNIADVLIAVTILLSTVIGIWRGFVREILTVITWVVAGVIAYLYGETVGDYFVFFENAAVREAVGVIAVFAAVVALGFLIKLIIIKTGKFPGISPVDRVVGALFGALRGCVLVILVLLVSSKNIAEQDWYKKSVLLPKFDKIADVTANATPETWKADLKREVDEVMQAQQSPAPVEQAEPTTVTDITVTVDPNTNATITTVTEELVNPASDAAPTTTTTTTKPNGKN